MKSTLGTKVVSGLALAGVLYFVLAYLNLVPGRFVQKAAVPESFSLAQDSTTGTATTTVEAITLPSTKPAAVPGPQIRMNVIPWNAEMGLAFANGGPLTTTDSLMAKHGVRLTIERQNDQNVSQAEQVKFAQALVKEPNPSVGVQFVVIMGDGTAQYLAAINKPLQKLGSDYQAEVIGAVGYSYGEDAFMGPEEWRTDPMSMKGGVVAGVLRDGDWNIALYDLQQNQIKNNPDEHTWDPDALNWVGVDDFTKAGELYVQGYCEDRDVVTDGKKTGERKHVCVQGVVTWTPGDVTVAKNKGGLVKILSTKENANQMPAAVIGIKKWDRDNAKRVEDMLAASFEGADQVRQYEPALKRGSQAIYAIFKEESPGYWLKYYKGVIESDKKGLPIPLGGSRVANLGDNLLLFGLADGTGGLQSSVFNSTYDGFGKISKQQYPRLVPDYPPVSAAVNTSYLEALSHRMSTTASEVAKFDDSSPIEKDNVIAKRNWNIQFETGKATFTPSAEQTLNDLFSQLTVGNLSVEVQGHTDNVGAPAANKTLSEARAFAVKQWLETKAPTLFPANRVNVRAFGDSAPIATNATAEGRAQNRRVTILLGTK